MIGKSEISNGYIGPKAIFDPYYIPPQILYRKKEERSLHSMLNDSFSDNYSLNILYQGIEGIGKKVIINKVLSDLGFENQEINRFQSIGIDCKDREVDEIVFSFLTEMNKFSNINLNLNSILNSKLSNVWNTFKLACKKIDNNLLLVLNNIESLKPEFFRKILNLGKETNTSVITTVNKNLKPSTLELLSDFDLRKRLPYFTYNQLNLILQQRTSLTFKHEIDKELVEYITDLIFEHYVPIPGKGIDILRDIYPVLVDQKKISYSDMAEVVNTQFDSSEGIDEFMMFSFISDVDLLIIIFLDNLSNYFLTTSQYYISSTELKDLYDMSCESIEYEKELKEYNDLLKMTQRVGILSASKKSAENGKSYFMILNPNKLKMIVDAVFENFKKNLD